MPGYIMLKATLDAGHFAELFCQHRRGWVLLDLEVA